MICINNRFAIVTKKYNQYVWQLKFIDNKEIINIFYSLNYNFITL